MFQKVALSNIKAHVAHKTAAVKELNGFDFNTEPGFLYCSARAVTVGVNDNYDAFSYEVLQESYRTFIDKPIYVEHQSDDIKRARGVILDARLNDEDPDDIHVEILMEMDEETFPVLCNYIRTGELNTMSMGAMVGYTTCSICDNVSYSEEDYCEHIKNKGTYYMVNGVPTLAYENCEDVYFYEESWVYVPACKSAITTALLKEATDVAVIGDTDLYDEVCPVCESTKWDGFSCSICGHEDESSEDEDSMANEFTDLML